MNSLPPVTEWLPHVRATAERCWPELIAWHEEHGGHPPVCDYELEALPDMPCWPFDKTAVLSKLGEEAHGTGHVPMYRTVVKPRWNRNGLAEGVREGVPGEELKAWFFWHRFYEGRHWSVDVVMKHGAPWWTVVAEGFPMQGRLGQFAAWSVEERANVETWRGHGAADRARSFARALGLDHFSGVVNVEMIEDAYGFGYRLIEVHLRPSLEFGPLYGPECRAALLKAAAGDADGEAPLVTGGTMIVLPKKMADKSIDAHQIDEESWRQGFDYYLP